jgi:multidrug efflux pump
MRSQAELGTDDGNPPLPKRSSAPRSMFSHFFINRPIFAAVLSIVITLAGGIAAFWLPLAQFPSISPPVVSVDCTYPGASAQVVSESVATPIEQQVNGVEDMLYMSSQCTNDGTYNLSVTFKSGVDLNMAQVMVQNRVNLALPSLPDVVKQTGVTTRKRSPDILMAVQLFSPNGRYDQTYLSNYALIQVKDHLTRIEGVSDVLIFGQRDYSMRIWLDPEKVAYRGLTASDILRAVREHNIPVAAGQIGQAPVSANQVHQTPIHVLGRLSDPDQYGQIVVKAMPDGRVVKLRDVAEIALGPKSQSVSNRISGQPCIGLPIFQFPDANALDVANRVLDKMDELKKAFPEDLDYKLGFDTTPFTRDSIMEVVRTLQEAIVLVAFVVLLFLQNWRSALIPLIAVPVAIIGTFAVMAAFGFSLNNLTLFGLVLAIGIVVDDAIVVVEAVEHHIENGMAPRAAAFKAMDQVSGPVIAVGLVLSAVFIPCTFIGGLTGAFFRQFAMTIAVSTIISTFNSLTLSPALAAILLRPHTNKSANVLPPLLFGLLFGWLGYRYGAGIMERLVELTGAPSVTREWLLANAALVCSIVGMVATKPLNFVLSRLFGGFNRLFVKATFGYTRLIGGLLRLAVFVLIVYGGLLCLTGWSFVSMPRGFVPQQDMGYMLVGVQLPDSASTERTAAVVKQMEDIVLETKGVKSCSSVSGQSFFLNATGSNFASMFVILKNFDERTDPELSSDKLTAHLRARFNKEILGANVQIFPPPPMRGIGRTGGFKVMVEDRGDNTPAALQKQVESLFEQGGKTADLHRYRPQGMHEPRDRPQGCLRHAAGLHGLVLRQRLQPLRANVAGRAPGRSFVSRSNRRRSQTEGPQRQGEDDSARFGRQGARGERSARFDALQHVPRRGGDRGDSRRRQLQQRHRDLQSASSRPIAQEYDHRMD